VRLALHRDAERVQVVLLANQDCCADIASAVPASALLVAVADPVASAELRRQLDLDSTPADTGLTIYLIDPNGNFFMTYREGTPKKGILSDLEKLLRLSHIG
jgi:hypothetical protein